MATNWTNQQLDAITAKNRAVVVSAAAGSGKTAVLVEKLLRILSDRENPVPADKIIVVTFTNDAAAQMKQRLAAALANAAELDPENEWLTAQQALISSAKISTIHSFCFSLIRENSGLIDIDSGFRVADPAENDVIWEKAAKNVFESWFEKRTDDMKRLTDFFCAGSKDERKLSAVIPPLRNHILALPFPLRFMDDIIKRYKNPPEPNEDELIKIYADYACKKLMDTARIYTECCDDVYDIYADGGNEIAKIKKNIDLLSAECERINEAIDRLCDNRDELFSGKLTVSFDKITFYANGSYKNDSGNKIECEFDKEQLEAVKTKRDNCKKAFAKFCGEFTYDDIKSDYMVHAEICEKLFSLIKDIFAEEKQLKADKNILGFSDAEQLACELLCTPLPDGEIEKSPLAKELSDYFEIVMIDEFQDSTAVQELIFRMISRDGTAKKPGTNFFAVGDVKQSIYRFRCADPRIFLSNITNSVPFENDGSNEPAYILLNKNFRSSHHVVEFVNAVFNSIMSVENGSLDYSDDDSLVEGAAIEDSFGPTEIIRLPSCDGEEDEEKITPADIAEAQCIAVKIKQMLSDGQIHDKGILRPLKPSDFCILTRNASKHQLFVSCLENLGIGAAAAAEESYLGSREISVLINLLRCIDNPTLDISMASVLMSPMFMFTAEDLGNIRLNHSSSLYADVIKIAAGQTDADKTLKNQCSEFSEIFGTLREFSASHSTQELIGYIYDKTDFMSVISVYKDNLKKKANLRLLPVYAAGYDKNGTGGLSGFIRQINNMLDSSKDFAAASAAVSADEAVAIKTIHRSKGLEYPFVFLCAASTKFNMTDINKRVVFTSDYGTAFKISDTERLTVYESFPRRAMSLILEKSQRDEEMMLLYVALTRAKNKLFITMKTDEKSAKHRENIQSLLINNNQKQNPAVSSGISMADWIDAAVGLFEKSDECYRLGNCELVFSDGSLSYENEEAQADELSVASFNPQRAKILQENMHSDYDLTPANTSAKITVSEIAKKHDIPPRYVFKNEEKSQGKPKGISAAAAGTAVHTFMQYADIKKLANAENFSDELDRQKKKLCGQGLMSSLEAQCVQNEVIEKFIESDICKKMLKSKEIMKEKKFLVKISDLNLDDSALMVYNGSEGMLQGVADCVFECEGEYILLDYKTDRNVSQAALTERYQKQLELYAKALSLILNRPVSKGYLYSFWLGQAVETEIY